MYVVPGTVLYSTVCIRSHWALLRLHQLSSVMALLRLHVLFSEAFLHLHLIQMEERLPGQRMELEGRLTQLVKDKDNGLLSYAVDQ